MGDFLDQANHPTTIYIINTLNKIRERRLDTNWTALTPGVDCGMSVRQALHQFQSFAGISSTGFYDYKTDSVEIQSGHHLRYECLRGVFRL